jgi:hypothetical protein
MSLLEFFSIDDGDEFFCILVLLEFLGFGYFGHIEGGIILEGQTVILEPGVKILHEGEVFGDALHIAGKFDDQLVLRASDTSPGFVIDNKLTKTAFAECMSTGEHPGRIIVRVIVATVGAVELYLHF